ncbi:MAG: MOSC domain-containing protein [Hyphomicrobiaceae bacterium]|nr:MOSC domain-containing protein [Hyphomicrobiaceae bacterium]
MRLATLHRYPVKSFGGESLARLGVERQGLAGDRRYMAVTLTGAFVTARDVPQMLLIAATAREGGLRLAHAAHGVIDVMEPGNDAERQMVQVWRSEVPARVCDAATNAWLSRVLGRDVRLVFMADVSARTVNQDVGGPEDTVSFADGYPLLLASAASLDDLNSRMAERRGGFGEACEMVRFRPNVVVEGAGAWDEDTWRVVKIGAVRFRVMKPCDRCVMTTLDPVTAEKAEDNEPLRTLGTFRRNTLGRIMFGQNLIPMELGSVATGDAVEVIERGASNLG